MGLIRSSNSVFKKYVTGYILVIFVDMLYTISVISAQLSMADTGLFEPNCIRFIVSTTLSLCLILLFKQSFKIEWQHVYLIILIGLCDYIYSTCYYVSVVFMPVGNLEGMFVAIWIICTTIVDLLRERIKQRNIAAAVLVSLGIFLMVQPWRKHNYTVDIRSEAPCETMTWELIHTNQTYTDHRLDGWPRDNQTLHVKHFANNSRYNPNPNGFYNFYFDIETSPHAIAYGYLLVTVAAVCATATSNLAQSLMNTYSVATLTFWIGMFEGLLSITLTFAFKGYPGFGGWSLPVAKYCLIFTFLYVIFNAVMDITSYYTYNFLPVSQSVILLSFTIIMLYMCQRTFLFNDGNANFCEVCGVLCTFTGAALSPMLNLCQKRSRHGYEEIK